MSKEFIMPVPYTGEEDGTFNHKERLTRDEAALRERIKAMASYKDDPYVNIYINRVIVFTDDVAQVKLLQSRLPEYFHDFDPLPFEYWVQNGGRPEPFRITYIGTEYLEQIKDKSKAIYFLPYSVIGVRDNGTFTELRDQSGVKWGRNNGKSKNPPDLIFSDEILNGATTL